MAHTRCMRTGLTSAMFRRYTPPVPGSSGGELETYNYENTGLFLISCYQYILVAAVFSIGPPYRKPMWTNGTSVLFQCGARRLTIVYMHDPTYA